MALIVGLVLAAGKGMRYGAPKVTAHNGQWLKNSVSALHDGGCAKVAVLLGAAVVEVPSPAVGIVVPEFDQGLYKTVLAGISYAQTLGAQAVMIVPVDIPSMNSAIIKRIRQSPIQQERSSISIAYSHALIRSIYRGIPGHPVLIGSDWFNLLEKYLLSAKNSAVDQGARDFFLAHAAKVQKVECSDLAEGIDQDFPEN